MTRVEDLTGFPECLDGRVKTLHPRVHAGILADRRLDSHVAQLADLERRAVRPRRLQPLPVPADRRVRRHPRRVRRADRHRRAVDGAGRRQEPPVGRDRHLPAPGTPTCCAPRPRAGSRWPSGSASPRRRSPTPRRTTCRWRTGSRQELASTRRPAGRTSPGWRSTRAGGRCATARTPTSAAALYVDGGAGRRLAHAEQLHGKEMSYNNYVDTDAALRAAHELRRRPTVAIIKHANPCGIAVGADVAEAHRKAHECDPVSAFGGVIATNRPGHGGDGRAGRRGVHRGDRRPGVRRRRGRGARRARRTSGSCVPSGARRRPDSRSARSAAASLVQVADRPRRRRRRPGDLDARGRRAGRRGHPRATWPSPGGPAGR